MNSRILGVLFAFGGLVLMPLFTLLTVVPFFLEIYGFPPLIPEFLKELNWHLILLIAVSLPVYSVLFSGLYVGYKKFKDPTLSMKEQAKKIYFRIPRFVLRLIKGE